MDGPRIARVLSREAAGRLQSCVRPFGAVLMTAGPDGFREPSPYQLSEPMGSLTQTGSLGPAGTTAFAITRFYPRKLAAPWLGGSCRCCHGPVLFSFAHDSPGDASRLVRQRHRRDKPVLSGAQRYKPGIGLGRLRPKQCRVCAVDQKPAEITVSPLAG